MTHAKEWPYYSKKKRANSHNGTELLLEQAKFFKADCVRSKHEKQSQNSRENFRVRTI